ncbi:MAG: amidohydrolase [Bacillota bacterium]|nr:amidohydrolase [Bacillota bacterium]
MDNKYILKSSCIFDSVSDEPFAGGVAVSGNKITGVYAAGELDAHIEDGAQVLDFGDKTIMPGFIDSHTHMGNFMEMADPDFCIDVSGSKSFEEVMAKISAFGKTHPDALLYAINFNHFDMTDGCDPSAELIENYISDRPVMIMTWDCHTWYANHCAMDMANMAGMEGYEDGVLNDTASYPIQMLLARPPEERKQSLQLFLGQMNATGITTVGDVFPCGVTLPYETYKAVEEDGKLTARICFYPSLLDFTPEEVDKYKAEYSSDMLQFAGLKAILDGVLTVHTAWMLKPYTNAPDTCGSPVIDIDHLKQKIMEACELGINCRIHAIGDAAIRFCLDSFQEANEAFGPCPKRHNIEHVEYCDPADVPRFAELGVVANMHLGHSVFYIDNAIDYLGTERVDHCFQWRNIKDTGAVMGTGSDFPVINFNPLPGIHAGVTRSRVDGYPDGGWMPDQKLTLPEALKMYTLGSAMAMNIEDKVGTLEEGKLADIVVLDRNIFDIAFSELPEVKPEITIVDGKKVYQK